MYGDREDRPRVGDRFPAFRLPTSDGGVFDLAAGRGKRHLLIFYRGSW
jgi:peroxiredoxin